MLQYLAGPLIGMVIGYCTNYLAVKMLFRPRTEKYLFGKRLPLTPGAIPKGKARLAKAAGEVVAKYLVTGDDIGDRLLADETEQAVANKVMRVLDRQIRQDIIRVAGDEGACGKAAARIEDLVTAKTLETLQGMDFAGIIGTEGKRIIMEKLAGTVFGRLLNEKTIDSLMHSISAEIDTVLETRGDELIRPHVARKIAEVQELTGTELLAKADLDETQVRRAVVLAYREAVQSGVMKVTNKIDIAGMIEEKINAMSPEELERLVVSVMKKELNTIINLGALIGLILGSLNIILK
ncbi:MAG: DUF445 family protein [Mogibacterium sp.]|nr:DUF445 family protein [Mogibacterium sp.]